MAMELQRVPTKEESPLATYANNWNTTGHNSPAGNKRSSRHTGVRHVHATEYPTQSTGYRAERDDNPYYGSHVHQETRCRPSLYTV